MHLVSTCACIGNTCPCWLLVLVLAARVRVGYSCICWLLVHLLVARALVRCSCTYWLFVHALVMHACVIIGISVCVGNGALVSLCCCVITVFVVRRRVPVSRVRVPRGVTSLVLLLVLQQLGGLSLQADARRVLARTALQDQLASSYSPDNIIRPVGSTAIDIINERKC